MEPRVFWSVSGSRERGYTINFCLNDTFTQSIGCVRGEMHWYANRSVRGQATLTCIRDDEPIGIAVEQALGGICAIIKALDDSVNEIVDHALRSIDKLFNAINDERRAGWQVEAEAEAMEAEAEAVEE